MQTSAPAGAEQTVDVPTAQVPAPAAVPATSTGAPATAAEMYEAAKAYRQTLLDQWERLRDTRQSVASATRETHRTRADIEGLEKRLASLDDRIVDMEKQIAGADAKEAQAAGVPGAILPEPPRPPRDTSPDWEEVLGVGAFLSFALLFPFAIAFSRRVWRRSAKTTVTLPPEVATRMQAMEDAIESVAVEVERIGEGQRFMTQALSESPRHLGAGAAEPVMVRAREAAHAERPF